MRNLPKGFSLQINGGGYGGIYVEFTKQSWRIALGWLAITLFFYDFEPVFHNLLKEAEAKEQL
jgi:hypothetical protein